MKKVYFVHFDGRTEPGVAKKIDAQIKEFNKYFDVTEICGSAKKDSLLFKIMTNFPLIYISKYYYDEVLSKIEDNSCVYIRRTKADKFYIRFLKALKKKKCSILVEIPTYPYFKDDYKKVKNWSAFIKELIAIPKFKKYVDRFITYSNDIKIFGVSTIKVKNGVYVDQIEPKKYVEKEDYNTINILAVATFRKHHGYERVIRGLADYYSKGGKRNIILRMVGEGEEKEKYLRLVKKLELDPFVIFLGKLTGNDLAKQYDIADIALGSFGMYKIDVFHSSVLKVREYLAKGLPIVSGCHEDAFENEDFEYYYEFPNDSSEIDIEKIVYFYDNIYKNKDKDAINALIASINEYAKRHIDYEVVFKNVINYITGEKK